MAAMLSLHEATAKRISRSRSGFTAFTICRIGGGSPSRPSAPTIPCNSSWANPTPTRKQTTKTSRRCTVLEPSETRPGAGPLIIHGDEDTIVHHNQSERFIAALREQEAGVEDMLIPGAGHHWFTARTRTIRRGGPSMRSRFTVAPVLLRFLQQTPLGGCGGVKSKGYTVSGSQSSDWNLLPRRKHDEQGCKYPDA